MKTFKEYLKENVGREDFKNFLNHQLLTLSDWMRTFHEIIKSAFFYLDLEKMDDSSIADVSTYLLHREYLQAIKYLYNLGYEPKKVVDWHEDDLNMYKKYLTYIKGHNIANPGVGYEFGEKVPGAYIPKPKLTDTAIYQLRRGYADLSDKLKESLR